MLTRRQKGKRKEVVDENNPGSSEIFDDAQARDEPTLPYRNVPELVHKDNQRIQKSNEDIPVQHSSVRKDVPRGEISEGNIPARTKEKAYKLSRPIDKPGTAEKIVDEIWKTRVNIELGDLVRASPEVAELLRRSVTKVRRKPLREHNSVGVLLQESAFPYMEDDDIQVVLQHDAIRMESLLRVEALYISSEENFVRGLINDVNLQVHCDIPEHKRNVSRNTSRFL